MHLRKRRQLFLQAAVLQARHRSVCAAFSDTVAAAGPPQGWSLELICLRTARWPPANSKNSTFWLPERSRLVRVLVLRDPFERLLSGYLFMVKLLATWDWSSSKNARSLLLAANDTSPTASIRSFAAFLARVSKIDVTSGAASPWHPVLNNHLLPLTSAWHREHNACHLLPRSHFDYVLRLESQLAWYPSFVRELNLTSAAQDPRWRDVQGVSNGCWWTAPGVPCANALIERNASSKTNTAPGRCSAQAAANVSKVVGHVTGACAKVAAFYESDASREAAHKYLEHDLAFWPFREQSYESLESYR